MCGTALPSTEVRPTALEPDEAVGDNDLKGLPVLLGIVSLIWLQHEERTISDQTAGSKKPVAVSQKLQHPGKMLPILHLFGIHPAASGRRESYLGLREDVWLVVRVKNEEFLPIGTKEIHRPFIVVMWILASLHRCRLVEERRRLSQPLPVEMGLGRARDSFSNALRSILSDFLMIGIVTILLLRGLAR